MEDPRKVVVQYRRMVQEGRLEMAEVMARGLSDRTLAMKPEDRGVDDQSLLVEVVRDLSAILEIREKWTESIGTSKILEKEARRLVKAQNSAGQTIDLEMSKSVRSNDLIQRGRALNGAKKHRRALTCFKRAHKSSPNSLEAVFRPFETLIMSKGNLGSSKKWLPALKRALGEAGPVQMEGEVFVLLPKNHQPHSVEQLLIDLDQWIGSGPPEMVKTWLKTYADDVRRQRDAIARGEQAKNAEMAAAIDKLQVTQDYHEWVGSR